MTVFVSDTFTDTDGVLLQDHTPEVGGTWVKRGGFGNQQIKSNELEADVFSEQFYTNSSSPGAADYNIEFDWNNVDDSGSKIGVAGRFLDIDNFYWFYKAIFNAGQNQQFFIKKKLSGNTTTLDSGGNQPSVSGIEAGKFELLGASQKGFAGGVEKLSTTDADLTLAGTAGTYSATPKPFRIDNYIATDTATPTSTNASMQPINVWWQLD